MRSVCLFTVVVRLNTTVLLGGVVLGVPLSCGSAPSCLPW